MADVDIRKRALNATNNSEEEEDDELIGPMPAPPPKPKKKRGNYSMINRKIGVGVNRLRLSLLVYHLHRQTNGPFHLMSVPPPPLRVNYKFYPLGKKRSKCRRIPPFRKKADVFERSKVPT